MAQNGISCVDVLLRNQSLTYVSQSFILAN